MGTNEWNGGRHTVAVDQPIDEFLADVRADLVKGELSPRVFNDAELHRLELEKIFQTCWIYVGHVTEIPDPGDYVLRYVGEDQFILARDEDGEINLLLNSCMHRAAPVCRADKGNTSHFRCPYHGWIYKNSGDWNGAPFRTRAYKKLDTEEWGLRKAPLIDTYQGLIFVCLDPDAISLREYLGDMCWYLDVMFGLNEQGMRVVGDPQRWVVPADWKSGAETFVGDAYHVPNLHRSGEEIGVMPPAEAIVAAEFHIALEGGHGMQGHRGFMPPPWGALDYPQEVHETFDLDRLSEDQRQFLENKLGVTVFTIFPNLSFIRAPASMDPEAIPVVYTMLRQWQPRGPGEMEVWNWPMEWISAPEDFNRLSYDVGVHGFSPSGIFEQDDTVVWSNPPRTGKSPFARRTMKLNFQLGLDGMSDCEIDTDWIGPGVATTTALDELNQRQWWQRWEKEVSKP